MKLQPLGYNRYFYLRRSVIWRANWRRCGRRKNCWLSSCSTPSNTRWRSLRSWTLGRWGERGKLEGRFLFPTGWADCRCCCFQEDMRLVIVQQVQHREEERQKERQRERENTVGLQRSKSLRVKGEGGKGFFSSLFKDKWTHICLTGNQRGLKLRGTIHWPQFPYIVVYMCTKTYQLFYFLGIFNKPLELTNCLVFQNCFYLFLLWFNWLLVSRESRW